MSSGPGTPPPPPPNRPGTPPPIPKRQRSDGTSRRRRKAPVWRVLEFLDFPVLVGWFYGFLDLFSFKGTEAVRRRRRRKRLAVFVGMVATAGVAAGVAWRFGAFRPPKIDFVKMRRDAETAQADKNYSAALGLWDELRAKGGLEVNGRYQRALALDHLDRKDDARQAMTELAERDGGYAEAEVWLAEDLMAMPKKDTKDWTAIEKYLDAAVAKNPKLVDSMRTLARLKVSRQKGVEAVALYERLAENNVDDRLTLAVLYAAARRPEMVGPPARSCLNVFQATLAEDPDNAEARRKAVQCALLLRNFDLADELLTEGLRRPNEKEDDRLRVAKGAVYSEWAEELARQGKMDQAVAKLLDALRITPEHPPTLQRLAVLAKRPEFKETARVALQTVLFEGRGMLGQVHGLLAALAAREGRRDEAKLHWRLSAENSESTVVPLNELALLELAEQPPNLPEALALVERGLAIAPDSTHLRSTRGRILGMQGKLPEALTDLQFALRANPKDPVLNAALYDVYMRQGMPDLANEHFSQAVESMPRLWMARARLALMQGDRAQATKLAKDAIKVFIERLNKDPKDFETLLLLVDAQLLNREYAESARLLEPLLNTLHKEAASRALAQVYAEWASSDGAKPKDAGVERLTRLEQAIELDPGNRLAIQDLALIARSGGPQAKRAQGTVDKLLAREPASPLAYFAAGTSAWQAGEKAEARKLLERAVELDPTNADVSNNLSWALSHSEPEDLDRALRLVEVALRRSPEHPNYRGTRGHLFVRMKRWPDARADLEHALKYREDPDNRRALNEAYKELGIRGPSSTPKNETPEKGEEKKEEKKGEAKGTGKNAGS